MFMAFLKLHITEDYYLKTGVKKVNLLLICLSERYNFSVRMFRTDLTVNNGFTVVINEGGPRVVFERLI